MSTRSTSLLDKFSPRGNLGQAGVSMVKSLAMEAFFYVARLLLLDLCSEPIHFSCPVFLVNAACCGCKHSWYAPPIPTSYPPAKAPRRCLPKTCPCQFSPYGYDPVQARWPHSSQGLNDIIKERRNFSRYQRHKGRFSSLKVCSLATFPTPL